MAVDIRQINLRDQDLRERSRDEGTRIVDTVSGPPSCEVAFISHYADIRAQVAGVAGSEGLLLMAVDGTGVAASAFVPRRRANPEVLIVGRHRKVDVWLGAMSIALRHLSVVVCAGQKEDRTRYRVLDLRTDTGLRDERGVALRSFAADGPVLFQVDRVSFLALPTAATYAWTDHPIDAWNALPPRTYDGTPFRHQRRLAADLRHGADRHDADQTHVSLGPAVVDAHRTLVTGVPVGEFEVETVRGRLTIMVDDAALKGGVLLGRYDRCDSVGARVLEVDGLSRVHALLVSIDGATYVVDTGSTYGVHVRGSPVRAHEVAPGEDITLGEGFATIRWTPVH